jgi:hypothetical protein
MRDKRAFSTSLLKGRFSTCAFLGLIALEVALIWAFPYFPSEDGPSHVHNASVLANYDREPIYRDYYRLTLFRPAGNMLTQFVLAGLLRLAGLRLAEKLFLTGYVILLPVSFRYALRALTPHDGFSFFGLILVPNYFLYMGLWNFCYSIAFLFLTLGFYFRHERRWTWRSILALSASGFVVYLTHAVSWVICLIAVAGWGAVQLATDVWGERGGEFWAALRSGLGQFAIPLFALLPPAILMLMHLAGSKEETLCGVESLRRRLHRLCNLEFLRGIAPSDLVLAKVVVAILVFLLVLAVVFALQRRLERWSGVGVLVVSLVCAVVAVLGPDCIGTGLFIHKRVGLYACSFFALWLAMQSWPTWVLRIVPVAFCAITLWSLIARFPVHQRLSRELAEFVAVGQRTLPQRTALLVELQPFPEGAGEIWPLEHALGLLSDRAIIDLDNYEAFTDYFSTSFRLERSPSPALGTESQLEAVPPVFDIERYERETRGRVDYILVLGNIESSQSDGQKGEMKLYGNQLAPYHMVSSGQDGEFRLYERTSPQSEPPR